MTNEEKLRQNILKLSSTNEWEVAKKEWYLHQIQEGEGSCLCGKNPIKYICILRNDYTQRSAVVGSSCVEKFIGLPTQQIFADIKLIRKNAFHKVKSPILLFARRNETISDWDYGFYNSILQWDKLSDKQLACLEKINRKLLTLVGTTETTVQSD